ncbi:MAG: hypothetical protein KME40_02515 [Komarekiella atlantica HA4396-MV6]|jgi:hypothetical protein|nr:hypothetical protein [Komarekiella atlantica HA4396-MV6]
MIISDLNILEVAEEAANIQGGTIQPRTYREADFISINFDSLNRFQTFVVDPFTRNNSASAGAKGDAQNFTNIPTYSFTKADTVAATRYLGDSFSSSTSAAVINRAF